jgi:hypothetical protein
MGFRAGGVPYGVVMQNPPNKKELLIFGLTIVISIIIGIIFTLVTGWLPEIFIFGGGSFILLLVIWNRQYRKRPKTAQVLKDGVLFTYRYGRKDRFVLWSSIYFLRAPPGDPDKIGGNWSQDGYLRTLDGTVFILHWPIAIAAKEAYKESVGKYPPELYENG